MNGYYSLFEWEMDGYNLLHKLPRPNFVYLVTVIKNFILITVTKIFLHFLKKTVSIFLWFCRKFRSRPGERVNFSWMPNLFFDVRDDIFCVNYQSVTVT